MWGLNDESPPLPTGESNNLMTSVLGNGFIELVSTMPDELAPTLYAHATGMDLAVVQAARVSYDKESKGEHSDKKLIKYLLKHKHWSPFEMASMKFRVYAPIFVARQWFRHSSWSYNEISRRYTSSDIQFYIPEEWRGQSSNNRQASAGSIPANEIREMAQTTFSQHLVNYQSSENSFEAPVVFGSISNTLLEIYEALIKAGVAREEARMILPQNTMTMFIAQATLRSVLHFLDQRLEDDAQYEIRVYAEEIEKLVKYHAPWTYEAWKSDK